MFKDAFAVLLVALFLQGLVPRDAIAGEEPPALSNEYKSFEVTWSNEDGRKMGRVVIAFNPLDSGAAGKIWFPKSGTCTWGNWGTIEAAFFRIDGNNRLLPTQDVVQMHINGDCGEASAAFEPNRNRLRVSRKNRPGYTFYIDLQP